MKNSRTHKYLAASMTNCRHTERVMTCGKYVVRRKNYFSITGNFLHNGDNKGCALNESLCANCILLPGKQVGAQAHDSRFKSTKKIKNSLNF